MNKVTSITILETAEGVRTSITFSRIDEKGRIIEENKRVNRIVVDPEIQTHIASLKEFAQSVVVEE